MSDRLKPGYYVGHIQTWNLGKANTGNPQFVLTFVLDHFKGPGGKFEDCPNLTRNIYRVITDKTIDYFVKDLQALGYDRDNFDDLDPKSDGAFDFEGIEIEAKLAYETYEGVEREKWGLAVGGTSKPLEADGVSSLNALFGDHLKALAGSRPPAPAASPGYAATPGNPDANPDADPF